MNKLFRSKNLTHSGLVGTRLGVSRDMVEGEEARPGVWDMVEEEEARPRVSRDMVEG
jgi:hypothetical protein